MKHYFLFDAIVYPNKTKPIITAAKTLIELLKIDAVPFKDAKADGGSEKMGLSQFKFFVKNAYNLSLASNAKKDILCIENSSFTSLAMTKGILLVDETLRNEVAKKLLEENVVLSLNANVCKLEDVIKEEVGFEKLSSMIKHPFTNFHAALFFGTSACTAKKYSDITLFAQILELIKAKKVNHAAEFESDGFEVHEASPSLAYKLAGKAMLEMFDNATDFVVVADARTFIMFDTHQKDLEKSVQRDIALSVFTLPQVLLMALGVTDKQKLGFDKHKAPITLI